MVLSKLVYFSGCYCFICLWIDVAINTVLHSDTGRNFSIAIPDEAVTVIHLSRFVRQQVRPNDTDAVCP